MLTFKTYKQHNLEFLMNILHGIDAPPGNGMVVEVHLDMMEAPQSFLDELVHLGFADDPFLDFFPQGYCFHYTGRARTLQKDLRALLPSITEVVESVLQKARAAGVQMYAESELVRDIKHFAPEEGAIDFTALNSFRFAESQTACAAKADIHVEFSAGTVPAEARTLLSNNHFYWVRTPASDRFPSEEIATLQATTFADASKLYESLVSKPLPGCTGIHLEQKLAIVQTHPQLPMPPVVSVTSCAPEARTMKN
jgi:hypothetical protein